MKLKLLIPMAVCFLGVTACEKTNVDPGSPLQANSKMNSGTTPTPVCDVISFKDASGFITQVYGDGGYGPIAVTSTNGSTSQNMARIFNSATALGTQDPDLHSTTLGNILISHDASHTNPNDYAGDVNFTFDFVGTVEARSLTFIDIEESGGTVSLYTDQGGILIGSAIAIPTTANNGTVVVSLGNTTGVGYIVVHLEGSGGLDNLAFCTELVRPRHCNYTQGYWKNHPEQLPESLIISGNNYSKVDLLNLLNLPVRGNGLISLLHQLIAAKLNVALDGGDSTINQIIADAESLINGQSPPDDYVKTSVTSELTEALDAYNNSDHCD